MQCTSCHFENIPGVPQCGRCGAVLSFGEVAINVHPPRAHPWIKPWRPWFYFLYRWRRPFDHAFRTVRKECAALYRKRVPWPLLYRMAVPGWPQFHAGRTRQGMLYFLGFLGSLPLGLFLPYVLIAGSFLFLAIAMHVSTVLDITIRNSTDNLSRWFYTAFCLTLITLLIYWPGAVALHRLGMAKPIFKKLMFPPAKVVFHENRLNWAEFQFAGKVAYNREERNFWDKRITIG